MMALLLSFKRFPYVLLVFPFLAQQLALVVSLGWRWAGHSSFWMRWVIGFVLLAALLEGGTAIWRSLKAAQATTPYLQVTGQVALIIPSGSRVLSLHHYWLGLTEYDVRAIDLAFVRSDPRYGFSPAPAMEQVIQEFDPEYVVLQEELLQNGLTAAYAAVNPPIARQWHEFDQFLGNYCSETVTTISDVDYGDVAVYYCE